MTTHTERHAAAAAEHEAIAAREERAKVEARRMLQDAQATRENEAAALEARLADEDDQAKATTFAAGDARLWPIVRALHDEATNRGAVDLIEAVEALDVSALSATGEVFPLRRAALLLAEVHRQARPGILEHLTGAHAWHSDGVGGGGGLGGVSFATELRKAVEKHDVAGARAAFEKFDAKLWSLTQRPIDEQALVGWQVMLQPDPRVLRAHQAAAAIRERDERDKINAASAARALATGNYKLGWPEPRGMSFSR